MSSILSISVIPKGEEGRQRFMLIANGIMENSDLYEYVTTTSLDSESLDAEVEDEEDMDDEVLYYDEETLVKVRLALGKAGCGANRITDCITELQNSGILFRERRQ